LWRSISPTPSEAHEIPPPVQTGFLPPAPGSSSPRTVAARAREATPASIAPAAPGPFRPSVSEAPVSRETGSSPAGVGATPSEGGSGAAEKPPAASPGPPYASAGRPSEVQIDSGGAPISFGRPMPVTISGMPQGGAWDQVLRAIEVWLGLSPGALGGTGGPGGAGTGGGQPRSKVSPEQTNLINQTIDQYAASWHIDPEQFKRMVGAESGYDVMAAGDDSSSFGLGQFHFGGISSRFPNPGMGDAFLRDTG